MSNRPTTTPDLTSRVMDELGLSSRSSRVWWRRERCSLACVVVGVGLFGVATALLWSTDTLPTTTTVGANGSLTASYRPTKASLGELPTALYKLFVPSPFNATLRSGDRGVGSEVSPVSPVAPLPWFGIEATPVPGYGYEAGVARAPGHST